MVVDAGISVVEGDDNGTRGERGPFGTEPARVEDAELVGLAEAALAANWALLDGVSR